MLLFHRRLAFRVLLPIVAFVIVFGAATFLAVLLLTKHFVADQAESNLRWRADAVRLIADAHVNVLLRNKSSDDRDAVLVQQESAIIVVDQLARVDALRIVIHDLARDRLIGLGELEAVPPLSAIEDDNEVHHFEVDDLAYSALTFSFTPWNWRITLVQGSGKYEHLKHDLMRAIWILLTILTVAILLFMLFLTNVTRRPVTQIVNDLTAGRVPHYAGITEFEYLSDSIARMMARLREQSEALERYTGNLEQLVQERTAELTKANGELLQANLEIEAGQQQLLQSEKLASIGQLAAGVAHEINNPIGFVNSNLGTLEGYWRGVMRMLEVYQRCAPGVHQDAAIANEIAAVKHEIDLDYIKGDAADLIAESRDGLGRVKKIVQSLKDFSHVGEDEWQIVDLHHNIDSTLNIIWNELKYKCEVVKDYGKLPEVECLASELNQVFMNILVNAGHAIAEHGTITIRTAVQDDQVRIEIADSGGGIAPEDLKRIFDPFFTTKPVGKGTGLGLSLSYNIVKKHHGRIEVESEPGRGAVFRIVLPVRQPPAEN